MELVLLKLYREASERPTTNVLDLITSQIEGRSNLGVGHEIGICAPRGRFVEPQQEDGHFGLLFNKLHRF